MELEIRLSSLAACLRGPADRVSPMLVDYLRTIRRTRHAAGASRAHGAGAGVRRRSPGDGGSAAARPWRRGRRRGKSWRVCTTQAYLDAIAATAGRAVMLDADTYHLARIGGDRGPRRRRGGSGGVNTPSTRGEPAFALVRPPGHHAERDRAMGFCLYNNVAVAAAAARASGAARVAIVDIDVHHGNGTQWMFYDDPAVLYVSSHQFPFYPGTGAADEIGTGAGQGLHRQRAARGGRDRRRLSTGLRGDRPAGARAVRSRR